MRSQCWVGESSRRQRVLLGLSGSFIYLVSLAVSLFSPNPRGSLAFGLGFHLHLEPGCGCRRS